MITETQPIEASRRKALWLRPEWFAALALFLATAGVVLWQNSQFGSLWDISFLLEHASRIAAGQLPYRDFPFPYTPITFAIQAAILKFTGRVYFHHVLYGAFIGGLASVLTWRVIFNLLRGAVPAAKVAAFFLSVPLIVLGVTCIFPHPFYDSDCTCEILLTILLLQKAERMEFPPIRSLLAGAMLVIPIFIKQNMGIAFFVSAAGALLVLIGIAAVRHRPWAGYVWILAGAGAGLILALGIVQISVGLNNYIHWTVEFAASRRLPALTGLIRLYWGKSLLPWLAALSIGIALHRMNRSNSRRIAILSGFLISLPFTFIAIYSQVNPDQFARLGAFLALWPFVLIAATLLALSQLRRVSGVNLVLPFLLLATINGSILSQHFKGSTYALWPFFMILVAICIAGVSHKGFSFPQILPVTGAIGVSMFLAGGWYAFSHMRMDYVDVTDGALVRSNLPALSGLALRGRWNPDFDELVRFSEREIPFEDSILVLPGEDLFYYATGRRPQFPVLSFDHTLNPYNPETILALTRERQTRWLIVKRNLQLKTEPIEEKDKLLGLLEQDFRKTASLNNYDIYRRNE